MAGVWEWTQTLPGAPGRGRIRWGFTAAAGGISRGPYEGLNLGAHVGDDPEAVRANRALLAADLGIGMDQLRFMEQVHGNAVADVASRPAAPPPRADAMIGQEAGLALVVLVADCVPVLLAAPEQGLIGVAHAGRPGLLAGVIPAVVGRLRERGAGELLAAVGPSVCGRCYEVPEDMRAAAAAVEPVSAAVSWSGTPAIDVAAGVVAQLRGLGVAVHWVPGCTRETPRLYSYRRAQVTGRFAGVVLREEP